MMLVVAQWDFKVMSLFALYNSGTKLLRWISPLVRCGWENNCFSKIYSRLSVIIFLIHDGNENYTSTLLEDLWLNLGGAHFLLPPRGSDSVLRGEKLHRTSFSDNKLCRSWAAFKWAGPEVVCTGSLNSDWVKDPCLKEIQYYGKLML